jgi:hypothetical protein
MWKLNWRSTFQWLRSAFICPQFQSGEVHYNRFYAQVAHAFPATGNAAQMQPEVWDEHRERAKRRTDAANTTGAQIERLLSGLIQYGLLAVGLLPILMEFVAIPLSLLITSIVLIAASIALSVRYLMPVGVDPEAWKNQSGINHQRHDWRCKLYLEELHDASFREHVNEWQRRKLWLPIAFFLLGLVCIVGAIALASPRENKPAPSPISPTSTPRPTGTPPPAQPNTP